MFQMSKILINGRNTGANLVLFLWRKMIGILALTKGSLFILPRWHIEYTPNSPRKQFCLLFSPLDWKNETELDFICSISTSSFFGGKKKIGTLTSKNISFLFRHIESNKKKLDLPTYFLKKVQCAIPQIKKRCAFVLG